MVDALRAARRSIVPGGLVLDVRPSARLDARLVARRRARWAPAGRIRSSANARARDRAADAAVRELVRDRLLRVVRKGTYWVLVIPGPLASVRETIAESGRFAGLVVARGTDPGARYAVMRPIQYAFLERVDQAGARGAEVRGRTARSRGG